MHIEKLLDQVTMGDFNADDPVHLKMALEAESELAQLRISAMQPQVPEGWQLVPKEPTPAMCVAAQEKLREWPRFPFRVVPAYTAMLAAAPKTDIK